MRCQVPQFIEIEDKILGPFTFKQFIYLAGSGGFAFVIFRFFPFYIAILLAAPVIAFGLALAFYRVNNKPFIMMLEAGFKYLVGGRLYIWKKEPKAREGENKNTTQEEGKKVYIPKMSNSKLSDLAWGLDIHEKIEEE